MHYPPTTRIDCSSKILTHRIDLSYKTDTSNEANIMHTLGRYSIGIILISCALFTACSRRSEPVGPRFSGRLLLLAGENTNGANLLEVNADGSTYNYSIVTSGVFEAAASPDRTRLLYTTKDGILLRDLRTGAVKPLVKGRTTVSRGHRTAIVLAISRNRRRTRKRLPAKLGPGRASTSQTWMAKRN